MILVSTNKSAVNNIKQTEGIDPVSIIFHKSDVNNSYSLTRDPLHSSLPALSDTNNIYNIVMINSVEMSSHGEHWSLIVVGNS